ncbi:hypothetical protein QFC22_004008 [Naganishia vaughanmartiniae]|uniref:Uncharacterized protein n=1 Tax=Naganishia vaughanmartiniae TaxID=1424756 RepID=A0ACC2X451_9TREE|nr:hypothetical protein QFC22_004008 [Naganishia vaughanmartiniae]
MVSLPLATGLNSPERVPSGNLESMESADPTAFMNPLYSSTDTSYGMATGNQPEYAYLNGEQHQAMSSNDYEPNQGLKNGVNSGYGYMMDPSAYRQDPAQMYGYRGAPGNGGAARGGANGYTRNRGGRDGGYRNSNNGWNQQYRQHNMQFPNQAFPNQVFQGQSIQAQHYHNFSPATQETGLVGDSTTMEADMNASLPLAQHQNGQDSGYASSTPSYNAGELSAGGLHSAPGYQSMYGMNGMITPTPSVPTPATGASALPHGQPPQPMPIGIYPYSHLGYGGKIPGVNGNPGRLPGTLPNGSMDPAQMTGNYGPAAAAAAAAAAGNTTGRTVYVGNLPADASVDELMNLVRFGPVESVRLLPEKSCVFISFLDGATAAAFHADATVKKLTLHGQELKIGWGHASVVPSQVVHAIAMSKATRNVYLGGLEESVTESQLRDDLSRFGPIDQVKIVRDKSIGFVHFLSITVAMKVVNTLPQEPTWQGKRIGYGKDRCAYVPRAQQAAVQAAQQQAAAALSHTLGLPGAPFQAFNPLSPAALYSADFSNPVYAQSGMLNAIVNSANAAGPSSGPINRAEFGNVMGDHARPPMNGGQSPNRCLYLGNLPEDATTSDICDAIRGGLLLSVKYTPEKHYAFVTFADPMQATHFYHQATSYGLMVKNKKVKVSWGRGNNFVHPSVLNAVVGAGATRIVYIGGIDDFDVYNEERLREDFATFGEIEQVNYLKEKKAAFVNFCDVRHASKALEGMKSKPEYTDMRLAYGKDRCANHPRPGHFGFNPRVPKDEKHRTNDSTSSPTPQQDVPAESTTDAEPVSKTSSITLASDQEPLAGDSSVQGIEKDLEQLSVGQSSGPDAVGTASNDVVADHSKTKTSSLEQPTGKA